MPLNTLRPATTAAVAAVLPPALRRFAIEAIEIQAITSYEDEPSHELQVIVSLTREDLEIITVHGAFYQRVEKAFTFALARLRGVKQGGRGR